MARNNDDANYYTILGVPTPANANDASLTPEQLKRAYRRALLLHHPDRTVTTQEQGSPRSSLPPNVPARFTVDQIIRAYEVLADPSSRAKYHQLLFRRSREGFGLAKSADGLAVETVDLDDLECIETASGGRWKRSCRCGSMYQFDERQLEAVARDGEIVVACPGCSLFIRVTFDAVEENAA